MGYLARSRLPGFRRTLDRRLACLAGVLSADLSGCRWCIDRGRHDSRLAGLSSELLGKVSAYSTNGCFTEREHAALSFVEAISRSPGGLADAQALQRARRCLSEDELIELTAITAEHHCAEPLNFDPI
jgi:alkylhydroperoxidase family enzyme